MDQLAKLNPEQTKAVECSEGPLLVLAGAGSGKTRVLTHRIAHLINTVGVNSWNVLAVTFTNKAAQEMRTRIEHLIGFASDDMWIGTFHSVCARILRYEAKAFGLNPSFTIYDEDDRRSLVRKILSDLNIDEKELTPRNAISQISRAKNAMVDAAGFRQKIDKTASPQRHAIADVFYRYELELRENHSFDFDDLICEPVRKLQLNNEILEKYQNRFRYILIDEYQDTNRPQYLLSKLLAQEHRNICCVGDDDQSIYHFRGADIRNILDFEKDYPEATVVRLEQNYRSTGRILAAANAVISHNRGRKGKNLWTQENDGNPLHVGDCNDDRTEARHIIATLSETSRKESLSLAECAILYRTNAQSRAIEEELQRGGIPYIIVGSIRFYERKEIKDLLAYFRVIANPADDISLRRIINVPKRGIGLTTINRLNEFCTQQSLTLTEAILHNESIPGLNARAMKSLSNFADIVHDLYIGYAELQLPALAELILSRSGYTDMLGSDSSPEARAREENVAQLVARISEFSDADGIEPTPSDMVNPIQNDLQTIQKPTSPEIDNEVTHHSLNRFLEEVALMSPVDEARDEIDTVTLMTLHMAKGLEFPLVIIAGMEEGLFPTARAIEESRAGTNDPIEEERRLFYVGITRAKKYLSLTFARWRYTYGSLQETIPSRFVEEIPEELVEIEEISDRESMGYTATQRRSQADRRANSYRQHRSVTPESVETTRKGIHYVFDEEQISAPRSEPSETFSHDDSNDALAVGRWVLHPTLGRGKIVNREGSGDNLKLSIHFSSAARPKKIMAAYAQLEPA